jgi:2,3-bisphosphoglycerate-dependent phosphoglycerate mutase
MDKELWDRIQKAAEESLKNPGQGKELPKDKINEEDNFIIVYRHGETYDNLNKIFSGWRDNTEITPKGKEQAEILADKVKDLKLDLVITSDQVRSIQTAEIVMKYHPDIKWETDWRIKERNYGDLNGQSKDEWMKKDPEKAILWRRSYDVPPPGGESIVDVEKRVFPFLEELIKRIKNEKINVALSMHNNSMRVARRYFENLPIVDVMILENPLGSDYALYTLKKL